MADNNTAQGNREAVPAGGTSGNSAEAMVEQFSEIGSMNDLHGVNMNEGALANDQLALESLPAVLPQEVQKPEEKQPEAGKQTATETQTNTNTQTQSKEDRHASTKINELTEDKLEFARMAIDADENAIYSIAKRDPKLAEKMLAEYDYGTDSLQELLAKKEDPNVTKADIETQNRISTIEDRQMNEVVARLHNKHTDLEGDLADEFKSLYTDPRFAGKSDDQLVQIARASLGLEAPSTNTAAQRVAVDMVKAAEGATTTRRGDMDTKKKSTINPQSQRFYAEAGVTAEKMDAYLPDNIDEIIAQSYGSVGVEPTDLI